MYQPLHLSFQGDTNNKITILPEVQSSSLSQILNIFEIIYFKLCFISKYFNFFLDYHNIYIYIDQIQQFKKKHTNVQGITNMTQILCTN